MKMYLQSGNRREGIVFLHGLANTKEVWLPVLKMIPSDIPYLVPDLPGCGQSAMLENVNMDSLGKWVLSHIQTQGWNSALIVGHSLGGQIALNMALHFPNVVKGVFGVAPAGLEHFTPYEKKWLRMHEEWTDAGIAPWIALGNTLNMGFQKMGAQAKTTMHQMLQDALWKNPEEYHKMVTLYIASMLENDIDEYIDHIKTKVLIVFGSQDQWIPNRFLHLHQTIENLRNEILHRNPSFGFNIYPSGGHFIQVEEPFWVTQQLLEFYTSVFS